MVTSWIRIVSACLALGLAAPAQALRITELLATNASTNTDEDGEFSDWLELHNESGAPVDVGGYYLTDDATLLTKWQLPSVVVPAGGYLLVWASDKNRTTPGLPLHTNFRLSANGEYLGLVQPNGTTVEHEYAPQFPPQITDVSYGLASDLSERCFLTPTPAAANDESVACGFTADVQFSLPHGFYDAPISVALTTLTPGATIRYTLDGTTPSPTVGTVYTSPIDITTTTVLRAIAVAPDLAPSKTGTQTYIFLDAVLQQPTLPPGYPSVWGSGVSADYAMDPDVVNDPLYAPTIQDDLKAIPTLSIVTDIDHLFGPANGIYTHPEGRGMAWERPASVEMIFPDGSDAGFQKNCGIRIQGETSRTAVTRKHSLSLRFRSTYDGPLAYPFFETAVIQDTPTESFSEIRLLAGHQNTWHSSFGGVPGRAQYVRDTYARDALFDMGQRSSHALTVHLYLNGLYWGIYGAKENPDADFFASYFGGTDDDYDVFKDNALEDGNTAALDALQALLLADMTSLANYQATLAYVDVESLADYVLMNFYIANTDWSAHNWIVGRKREAGAGFKFFSWDAELSLGGALQNNLDVNGPLGIYGKLRASPEFRLLFADRVHRHLFDGGALTPARAATRFLKRSLEIDRAVVGESARWGDKLRPTEPFTRDKEWLVEKFRLLLEFFPARTDILLNQLVSRGDYPTIVAPSFNQHGGSFFPGFALVITAPAGTIYYTADGSDPRLPGGAVAPGALVYGAPIPLSTSVQVLARAQVGGQWSALTEASFVRETPLRITELMYNATGGSNFDFLELKNIGTAAVDLGGLRFTEGIDFTFPSTLVAPGAHALIVKNQASFDTLYGAGKPVVGVYAGNLSDGGERLRLEDADGNAIHDFSYVDSWYPTTDGGGYSLVIRNPLADKSAWGEASGWRASTFVNGSAGAMEAPLCGDGVDNDGDTAVDLADPGCADASQDVEDPECNDSVDNDGDAAVDLADPECTAASETAEAPAGDDASLCYRSRTNAAGGSFSRVDLTLSDAFESGVRFTVVRPLALCLAGALNSAPTLDPDTHLESYKLRDIPGEAPHVRRTGLQAENVFGPLTLDTIRPDRLLVPTAKDTGGPVGAPDPSSHDVDHYKCYKMKQTKGATRYFPRAARADFDDDFEHRTYAVRTPKLFCAPVDQEGQGIKNAAGYLVCYTAQQGPLEASHVRRVGVYTGNDLGGGRLDTIKEEHLCVPTRLLTPP